MELARRAGRDRRIALVVQAASLAALLAIGAAPTAAQSAVKQVLMLQSLDRGNLTLDQFTGDFRIGLDERAGPPVNVVQVVVGRTGFVAAPEHATVDYLRSIYANSAPPDLIVTIGGPAAAFAQAHRQQLFPRSPLLYASVDKRWLQDGPLGENEAAVAVLNDFPRLVDDILQVLPDTRQIFMLVGSGAIGRFWRRQLDTALVRFRGRVTFAWSSEQSLSETRQTVATLPPHSAIAYVAFGTDAQGGAYADEQLFADLHAHANAPAFAAQSSVMGHGIVGGSLLPIDDLARKSAVAARRILAGEAPRAVRVRPQEPGRPTFDWRELERWGIPESRLPAGSVVEYRPQSLWAEHKRTVLTAVGALVLQFLLIALLLLEQGARRRAEIESRQNLELAADANRRETVSALTASISHELGQPLAAIVHNAQALQMMVAARQAPPEATAEILGDIKSEAVLATQIIDRHRTMLRGHHLDRKPIDLHAVIDDTLALVGHDLRARQIETALDLSSSPAVIDGDQVLLGQVFVNLVRNAIDALAETPAARRRITIRSAVRPADVTVSVRDSGTGLPTAVLGALFTPFATTKAKGLGVGLAIAQRIVEAHGGTITARENDEGGALFTVTLPRSGTPERVLGTHGQSVDREGAVASINGE